MFNKSYMQLLCDVSFSKKTNKKRKQRLIGLRLTIATAKPYILLKWSPMQGKLVIKYVYKYLLNTISCRYGIEFFGFCNKIVQMSLIFTEFNCTLKCLHLIIKHVRIIGNIPLRCDIKPKTIWIILVFYAFWDWLDIWNET